jgi:c-di-GMP-binding flagellar brake protein YcgR
MASRYGMLLTKEVRVMLKKQQYTATQERRKRIRLNRAIMITLCPSQYLLRTNALSRDISEDGICLVSPYKIDIGQTIELTIHLPEFKKPAVVVGEIVRRNETDDPQYPYLMGIKFISINPNVSQPLQEHMRFYRIEQ